MNASNIAEIQAPSASQIAKATVAAIVIAVVVLFAAVLPAEYGWDPLGTGKALGLTNIAESPTAEPGPAAPAAVPVASGAYRAQAANYKVDSRDIELKAGEGIEIKYHMEKGATMIYSWKANDLLRFEFHGEPDQKPNPDYYDSYEKDDEFGKTESHGSFVAPSTGIHGWFWENNTIFTVTLHLNTAGFYDSAVQMNAAGKKELKISEGK